MTSTKEILLSLARGNVVCGCGTMSTCATAERVDTILRSWEELIDLLEDAPHMVVTRMLVRPQEQGKE